VGADHLLGGFTDLVVIDRVHDKGAFQSGGEVCGRAEENGAFQRVGGFGLGARRGFGSGDVRSFGVGFLSHDKNEPSQ
jgi:hypothetical protein